MTTSSGKWIGRSLVGGTATGRSLLLDEPLSFWGGMSIASGRIIDQHHPQRGALLSGRILIMPAGRGSSSSSSTLAEAIAAGTAPAAIIITEPDVILAVGALVAAELYGKQCPIIVLAGALSLPNNVPLALDDGLITEQAR